MNRQDAAASLGRECDRTDIKQKKRDYNIYNTTQCRNTTEMYLFRSLQVHFTAISFALRLLLIISFHLCTERTVYLAGH